VLILLRGESDPWMPLHWGLPGGHVEDGESYVEGAARELSEETDIHLDISELRYVDYLRTPEGRICVFGAYLDYEPHVDLLDGEHEASEWVYPRDFRFYRTVPGLMDIMTR